MKKDLAIIFGLVLLVVVLVIFGGQFTSTSFLTGGQGTGGESVRQKGYVPLNIRTLSVNAKLAQKPSERKKGLSGLESLPLSEGMLFIFENKGFYAFWMKDVKFAIDIIWIDENKRVVDIYQNVPPEPGRKDDQLAKYYPRTEALYVLEVNAGLSELNGITIGDQVEFDL